MTEQSRNLPAKWTRINESGVGESVLGSIEISPDHPTHLIHLTEDFTSSEDSFIAFMSGTSEVDVYPVLHGQTQEGLFTAIDSRPFRSTRTLGGSTLSDIVLRPSLVIQGNALLHEHELSVTKVVLRFWDQDDWAQWFNVRVKNATKDDRTVYFEQRPPNSQSLRLAGAQLSIRDASRTSYFPMGHGKISISQTSVFEFEFDEEVRLQDFMTDWIAPISFWVSSGTRRTSGIEHMSIFNRNWKSDSDGSAIDSWQTVIPRNPKRKFSNDDKLEYLHRLKDFDFETQVPMVLATYNNHRAAVDQYLDYLHNTPSTPMVRLTVLAQLVETFDRSLHPDPHIDEYLESDADLFAAYVAASDAHRKYASNAKRLVLESIRPTLASRLKRLDSDTGKLISNMLERPSWKSDIAGIRNSIVHGLPSSVFFLKNVIPIQISIDILELLFELQLLRSLGFSNQQVEQIVTQDDPNWAGRKHHVVEYLNSFDDFNGFEK